MGAVVPSIVDNVDVDDVVARVDVNELIERVDVDALLDRIEPDRLLDRIDVDRLLDRIDVDRLLDRIDVEKLVGRIDVDALLADVDVNGLVERVDVNDIVRRTELERIIARSTTGVFTSVLDVVRTRFVSLDQIVHAVTSKVLHRGTGGPGTPSDPMATPGVIRGSARKRAMALQGHYAGAVSRFAAFAIDQFLVSVLFGVGVRFLAAASEVVLNRPIYLSDGRWGFAVGFALWWYLYFAAQLSLAGRTIGKAILGLAVVGHDGTELTVRQALLRPLAFPLSFLLFGVGFLIGLARRDRRQLHDLLAHTAVVYEWDPNARLRDDPGV